MSFIGRRLKFFRQNRKISQMDVELGIDAAFGSISRIESGKVNPTKETVERIANYLHLTDSELDYIIGATSMPATIEETANAINEVNNYFEQNGVIAYLVDDRFRMIKLSKTIIKILGLKTTQVEELQGKTLVELMLHKEFGIAEIFSKNLEHNLYLILNRFYSEMYFMHDDEYYNNSISAIEKHPQAISVWENIKSCGIVKVYNYSDRKVLMNIAGVNLELRYANEPLTKYKRFDVVEYIPTNDLFKLFAKFI